MNINIEKIKLFIGYILLAFFIFLIIFIILFFEKSNYNKSHNKANFIDKDKSYNIKEVLDGDTFVINIDNKDITIRLLGIDTPETLDPRKTVQCYGREASDKAKSILLHNYVFLERDINKSNTSGDYDKYGRVLAYARLSNGLFYNQYMIENGFAYEYTFNKEKYKYQKEFKEAEAIAKKTKKGLWKKCI